MSAERLGRDTTVLTRRGNLRWALQLVFRQPGLETRAGIARATGLTAATASSLVAELIDKQLVVEGEQAQSRGGKRATTLSIDATRHLLLAAVVRTGAVHVGLVALDGTLQYEKVRACGPGQHLGILTDTVNDVNEMYGARILATAVQVQGTTDGRVVLESVRLGWTDLPLAERLEHTVRGPVVLINDVDAEAIAEAVAEIEPRGRRLFVHVGAGVGAAVTFNGARLPGPQAHGGEIGHVRAVWGADATTCVCGRTGCLESAVSMTAMLDDTYSDALDSDAVQRLVAHADPERIRRGARALAQALTQLVAMLDPAEVVLGGPAVFLGDDFLSVIADTLADAPRGTRPVPVRYANPRVGLLVGAAQVALSEALDVQWGPHHLISADATVGAVDS